MEHTCNTKGTIFPGHGPPGPRPFVELCAEALAAALERKYASHVESEVLGRLGDWKKADVERVLRILAGRATTSAQVRLAQLAEAKGKAAQGRGVIAEPKKLDTLIGEGWIFYKELWSPDTPPKRRRELYKQTKWFPYFVEAGYRGELAAAQLAAGGRRRTLHDGAQLSPSEEARKRVAAAAGITVSLLDKLCNQVRRERHGESAGERDDPEMSAAELRRRLEDGPRF